MRLSLKLNNKWYCIYLPPKEVKRNLKRKDYLDSLKLLKELIGEDALINLRNKYLLSKIIIAITTK